MIIIAAFILMILGRIIMLFETPKDPWRDKMSAPLSHVDTVIEKTPVLSDRDKMWGVTVEKGKKVMRSGITIESDIVPLEMTYRNIADQTIPFKWFECPHPDLPSPSPAEALIITELNKYHCKWFREVSFNHLQVNTYSHPRFDFYIPSKNLIIEYDGKMAHNTPQQKAMDKLKTRFCISKGITIIRYSTKDYYHLSDRIADLMEEYSIAKK